jgi:hypothetical protein
MEDDILIKQNFLRSEVIEQGYSADLFVNFLSYKKPENADDLNSYTFEELKIIVEEFKQQSSKEESRDRGSTQTAQTLHTTQTILPSQPATEFEEIITCKKMARTPLTDTENLKITITEYFLNFK